MPPTAWPARPDALQEGRDRARRAELADQVDVADVDAQLQRGGGDQRLQLAALQPLFGVPGAAPWPGCRGARRRRPRRGVRTAARAARSAMRRVLTNTSVVRCSRPVRRAVRKPASRLVGHHRLQRRRRHFQRQVALAGVADVDDGAVRWRRRRPRLRIDGQAAAAAPTRKRATPSIGFCVADRPMRSQRPLRTAPPAAPATAPGASRACCRRARGSRRRSPCALRRAWRGPTAEPSSTYSDSGVVTRMCGGRLRIAARSRCGVSPVRTAVRMSTSGRPSRSSSARMPASGCSRLRGCRWTAPSAATRRPPAVASVERPPCSRPSRTSASIAARKAARVLPDPVGAAISVLSPRVDRGPRRGLRRRRRLEAALEPGGDGRVEVLQGHGGEV